MRVCKVIGCSNKHSAKGYCWNHYMHFKYTYGFDNRKCSFEDCEKPLYARGFCRNHHTSFIRNGFPQKIYIKKMCMIEGCNEFTTKKNGLCNRHNGQLYRGKNLLAEKWGGKKGEFNNNWNGGTSEYKHHGLMKRIRKELLIEKKYTCSVCGEYGNRIHHLDGSKTNHCKDNLVVVCNKCHFRKYHNFITKKTSKLAREYGIPVSDIMKNLGVNYNKVRYLHQKGVLRDMLINSPTRRKADVVQATA